MPLPPKLTDMDVMTIRALHYCRPNVYSYRKLSCLFEVNRNTIWKVLKGINWAGVIYPIGEYAENLRQRFIDSRVGGPAQAGVNAPAIIPLFLRKQAD